MDWAKATAHDARYLALMNYQLIHDEGHRNPMTIQELEERMRAWLASGEYEAVLFGGTPPVAYALFRREPESIYLRQFFVQRHLRGQGVGRAAMATLLDKVFPPGMRISLEVLASNDVGIAFWASLGFQQYALTMELSPNKVGV